MWCNRPRMALDNGRKSTSPSSSACHFLDEHIQQVRAFFALSHLASRLTPLFGELATGLHVHQRDASLICSLFRPCGQALFGKGDRQVAFRPDEISKNDHSARTQRSTGWTCTFSDSHWFHCAFLKFDKLKTSSRLSAICCALATFCNHQFAPTTVPMGLAQSCIRYRYIALDIEHATCKCIRMYACMQMAVVDRARSTHAAVAAAGRHACQLGWRFFFFFWIRGSTDLRRFERIFGGSGSIRVSVDSFYP